MRNKKLVVVSVIILVGFVICAALATLLVALTLNSKQTQTPNKFSVTIDRGPCFGFCPIYKATVDQDGKVNIEYNDRFESEKKTTNYEISEDSAKKIMEEVNAVKFFDLKDKYEDIYVTDLPSLTITVTADGKTKSIYMYGLDNTVPEELTLLGKQIDNYLNIDKYLPNPNPFPTE